MVKGFSRFSALSIRTILLLYPDGLFDPGYLSRTKSVSLRENGSNISSDPYVISSVLPSKSADPDAWNSDSLSHKVMVAIGSVPDKRLKINAFLLVS